MKRDVSLEEYFFGAATVGDRGQVVIPADARKSVGINPGDKVLVIGHPTGAGLLLCKIDAMREFFTTFQSGIERIASTVAQSDDQQEHEN